MFSLSFQDVEKLFDLPRLLDNYEVPLKGFNHVDFIWGIDARIMFRLNALYRKAYLMARLYRP